jgi:hypothetical protein
MQKKRIATLQISLKKSQIAGKDKKLLFTSTKSSLSVLARSSASNLDTTECSPA